MLLVSLGFSIALLLQVWFNSNAVVEYANLFDLSKFCPVIQNFNLVHSDTNISFIEYLVSNHSNFFIRLITCKLCLSTVIGILLLPFFGTTATGAAFLGLFSHSLLNKIEKNA